MHASGPLTISGSRFFENLAPAHKGYGGGGGLIAFGVDDDLRHGLHRQLDGRLGRGRLPGGLRADVDDAPRATSASSATPPRTAAAAASSSGSTPSLTGVEAIGNYAGYRGGGVYGSYAGNYGLTLTGGSLHEQLGGGGRRSLRDGDIAVDGTEMTGNVSPHRQRRRRCGPPERRRLERDDLREHRAEGRQQRRPRHGNEPHALELDALGQPHLHRRRRRQRRGGNATVTRLRVHREHRGGQRRRPPRLGDAVVTESHFSGNTSTASAAGSTPTASRSATASSKATPRRRTGAAARTSGRPHRDRHALLRQRGGATPEAASPSQFGATEVTGGRFEGNQASARRLGRSDLRRGPSLEIDGTEFVVQQRGGRTEARSRRAAASR